MPEAINRNSYVWSSTGVQPVEGDESYQAGEQPIAEYDNYTNWSITTDIKRLSEELGAHSGQHEAGGTDPLDLTDLPVGSGGYISDDLDLIHLQNQSQGTVATLNTATPAWEEFPPVNDNLVAGAGIEFSGGLLNMSGHDITDDGAVIYDASAGVISGDAIEDVFLRKSGSGLQDHLNVNGYDILNANRLTLSGADQNITYDSNTAAFSIHDTGTTTDVLDVKGGGINFRRDLTILKSNPRLSGAGGSIHMGGNTLGMEGTVDFNSNEATNFRLENRTSDPTNPDPGQMWLRTDR